MEILESSKEEDVQGVQVKLSNRRERRKKSGRQLMALAQELNDALEGFMRGEQVLGEGVGLVGGAGEADA